MKCDRGPTGDCPSKACWTNERNHVPESMSAARRLKARRALAWLDMLAGPKLICCSELVTLHKRRGMMQHGVSKRTI